MSKSDETQRGKISKKKHTPYSEKTPELMTRISSGTYDMWLEEQLRHRHAAREPGERPAILPTDTMQDWLSKQHPISREVPKRREAHFHLDDTEEWIERQVAKKLSKEKSEDQPLLVVPVS